MGRPNGPPAPAGQSRDITLAAKHDFDAADYQMVEERLDAFNMARTGHDDAAQVGFVAEVDGVRAGALTGYTWAGICGLRQVWVEAEFRGMGIGRMLVERAIGEALSRNCHQVLLETFDFQAPAFYRKLGFTVVAEIPDKPLGHTEFIMRLWLTEPPRV